MTTSRRPSSSESGSMSAHDGFAGEPALRCVKQLAHGASFCAELLDEVVAVRHEWPDGAGRVRASAFDDLGHVSRGQGYAIERAQRDTRASRVHSDPRFPARAERAALLRRRHPSIDDDIGDVGERQVHLAQRSDESSERHLVAAVVAIARCRVDSRRRAAGAARRRCARPSARAASQPRTRRWKAAGRRA